MIKESQKLAIALPTYNRADFLEASLATHLPWMKNYGLPVYISDNGSTDHTKAVVEKYQKDYPYLHYLYNEVTVTADENFEKVLKAPTTEYIWLLGDTYQITPQSMERLWTILAQESFDLCVFNIGPRQENAEETIYTDQNQLLSDLGWLMSCLSALVFHRSIITTGNFKRYRGTHFIHEGIAFESLADRPFRVKWIPQHSLKGLDVHLPKTSWHHKAFEIWTKSWSTFVLSFPPSYTLESKLKCIKDCGQKSKTLSLRGLKGLRIQKNFTPQIYKQYKSYFPMTIQLPRMVIWIMSWIPKGVLIFHSRVENVFIRAGKLFKKTK